MHGPSLVTLDALPLLNRHLQLGLQRILVRLKPCDGLLHTFHLRHIQEGSSKRRTRLPAPHVYRQPVTDTASGAGVRRVRSLPLAPPGFLLSRPPHVAASHPALSLPSPRRPSFLQLFACFFPVSEAGSAGACAHEPRRAFHNNLPRAPPQRGPPLNRQESPISAQPPHPEKGPPGYSTRLRLRSIKYQEPLRKVRQQKEGKGEFGRSEDAAPTLGRGPPLSGALVYTVRTGPSRESHAQDGARSPLTRDNPNPRRG
eukprot:scaffold2697_cov392-Prasinococcus_capsulatus_cf.AAC.4